MLSQFLIRFKEPGIFYMKQLKFTLLFLLLSTILIAQTREEIDRGIALQKNKIGKPIIFERSKKDDADRLELSYLGKIITKDKKVFKILTSKWIWGYSKRGTSRILIYNEMNKFLGDYCLTMTYDVPKRIQKTFMVFDNKNRAGCDKNIITKIDFANGIPESFFLDCKNGGDIYTFDAAE